MPTSPPLSLVIYGREENWPWVRESGETGHVPIELQDKGEQPLYLTWAAGYTWTWLWGDKPRICCQRFEL